MLWVRNCLGTTNFTALQQQQYNITRFREHSLRRSVSTRASTLKIVHFRGRKAASFQVGDSSISDRFMEKGVRLSAVESQVSVAVEVLRSSQIIALPSDTLYGLAGDACSAEAIHQIYRIKGRNPCNPLAICVADVADVSRYAQTSHIPAGMLDNLFPGPVTLVLPKGLDCPLHKTLNPGLSCIGIRIPDSEFIRAVARSFGGAMALTSANLSGAPSSVQVNEFEPLWVHCGAVFDGGLLSNGRNGSTIVDLTQDGTFKILRDGSALEKTVELIEGKYELKKR